jgi:hypothetical protein
MVRLVQTVLLSCSDANTVSKQTKMRFHMSHVTLEFHRVHPKRFPSLWNVWCKQSTYLEPRLALCPNRPKWAFTWASLPRSTIGSDQNDYLSPWYVWYKSCTYLALTLTLSPNGPKHDLTRPTSSRGSVGCIRNDFWAYGMIYVNHAPILHQD